ncbi:Uncharacterised protein [Yersinia kristensenii]|uniref:Uncharacterized protein n=1 Tax=Yersinia kristensenii TaxID=28152 RepID=A0A0T9M4Y2_YERKR|nr:Uncharacterised protein [Yersinia kristensenii]CNF28307.1 Uncharacterised protein [Yersinia kristensenii]CNF60279.1 Uncharacterised protein [Yersinia kristensenii]CNH54748.1 Uncharacterised protein [Yersinia kristensenii]CNK89434.1 Uncharacterised protein [Yersinia kristensenii]
MTIQRGVIEGITANQRDTRAIRSGRDAGDTQQVIRVTASKTEGTTKMYTSTVDGFAQHRATVIAR